MPLSYQSDSSDNIFGQLKYLDMLVQAPTPKTRLFLYCKGVHLSRRPSKQTPHQLPSLLNPQILGMAIKYGRTRGRSWMEKTKVPFELSLSPKSTVRERLTRAHFYSLGTIRLAAKWTYPRQCKSKSNWCEMITEKRHFILRFFTITWSENYHVGVDSRYVTVLIGFLCHSNYSGRQYLTVAILGHCGRTIFQQDYIIVTWMDCARLDLPCSRERPPHIHPDEMPTSPVTTMYYTARWQVPTSSPPDPDPGPGIRHGEKSGKSKRSPCECHTDQ
jgi:hypothetical protein